MSNFISNIKQDVFIVIIFVWQVACLARKTTYKNREAIAIGNVGLLKADLFSELSSHKDKSKALDTREFRQENGQIKKGCNCSFF